MRDSVTRRRGWGLCLGNLQRGGHHLPSWRWDWQQLQSMDQAFVE